MHGCVECLHPLILADIHGQETGEGVRLGEGCHMTKSPSGELLKKPISNQVKVTLEPLSYRRGEKSVRVCVYVCAHAKMVGGVYSSTCWQCWVLDNLKTQAVVLLAVLIFLLSGHFYSKSLGRLSLLHISFHSCSWIFTGGIQVNCLCSKAEGEQSMSQQSSGHQSIFPK